MDIRKYFGSNNNAKPSKDLGVKLNKSKRIESDSEEEVVVKSSKKKVKTIDPASFFESKCDKQPSSSAVEKNKVCQKLIGHHISRDKGSAKNKHNSTPHKISLGQNKKYHDADPDCQDERGLSKSGKVETPLKRKAEAGSSGKSTANSLGETPKKIHKDQYIKYLHREGPSNPGGKDIPKGKSNCLNGMTFVITGVLDSLEREEAETLIKSYGGRVTHSVSHKTTYLVLGKEPGQSKLKKATEMKTKQISEDDVLELIRISGKDLKEEISAPLPTQDVLELEKTLPEEPGPHSFASQCSIMLVDKYKPVSTKQVIGQQGDKSCLRKLQYWLSHWAENNRPGIKKSRPGPWAKNDDGSYFKAALLSGSPGIGKTTTAHLVSKELGYDIVELNASDTRSKSSLHNSIGTLLTSKAIVGFYKGNSLTGKHVLILDEIDGMAGNEDRGGINEVIQLIKTTKVPVVCICNDRSHPKMRSLVNYCFDLRFPKPRVEQIKGALMSLLFKEGIQIKPDALSAMISSADHDVRQILNNISIWAVSSKAMNSEKVKNDANYAKKDIKLGPWDVVKKVFSPEDQKKMTLQERSDLFFYDYSLQPLFVQENYLSIKPRGVSNVKEELVQLSRASDCIASGDLISKTIMSEMAWSLLPVQAMFSSVLPGYHMAGNFTKQIEFPSWFGKNSKAKKNDRLLSELQLHMRLIISGSKEDVNLDYINKLYSSIYKPLVEVGQEAVTNSLKLFDSYYLLREDLDSLNDLCDWSLGKTLQSEVDSKVKASFTRAINKENRMNPYHLTNMKKELKKVQHNAEEGSDQEQQLEEEEDGDDDLMVKKVEHKAQNSKGQKKKKK